MRSHIQGLAIGGKGWPLYQLRRGCTGDRLSQCHLRPANPIATIDGHMAVTNGAKAKAWSFSGICNRFTVRERDIPPSKDK